MGKCLPPMNCYDQPIMYTTYPNGCNCGGCNSSYPISTDNLQYIGPNLPNSGIQTDMLLTEAIQRLDFSYSATGIRRATIAIGGGSPLQGIGTTPIDMIIAPGTIRYLNPFLITVSYLYGSQPYNFGVGATPVIKFTGSSGAGWRIPLATINQSASFNGKLAFTNDTVTNFNFESTPTNTGLVLTSENGANASQGDGTMIINILYTIENTNI